MAIIKANMDGELIHLGDQVYVLLKGNGTVTAVFQDGTFEVSHSSGGPQIYTSGGMLGKSRRVFWQDPFLILPPRNSDLWNAYKRTTIPLYQELKALVMKGTVSDVDEA